MLCPTVHSLLSPVFSARATIVGIDGLDNCRKTSLAARIAGHTGHQVINLDSMLDRNRGSYVDFIDIDALRLAAEGKKVVIEGVCLLRVLERAELDPDLLIYVKRNRHQLWADEDELGLNEPLEAHLERLRQFSAMLRGLEKPESGLGLGEEIIRYHHEFRPHERADITYVWNDC